MHPKNSSYLSKISNLISKLKSSCFKENLPLGIKYVLLFLCFFVGTSCTTFRYYHANYQFKEKTYNPVKKGRVELTVYGENTFSERPGAITSWQVAHKKGLTAAKQSIKQFCEGDYMIKTIAEKKENLGTKTDTAYRSDYRSQQDSYRGGAHNVHTNVMGKMIGKVGRRGGTYGRKDTYGTYAEADTSSEHGSSDGYSTSRTAPVFREYTDITFQCKK